MAKKNTNAYVDIQKYFLFAKEIKLHIIAIIILLLTIKFNCGWETNKFTFGIQCNPLSISQLKEVIQ